jgi:electron transport protein HydN
MSTEQSFFVLADSEKCTGCRACELACYGGHQRTKIKTVGNITSPVVPRLYLARGEGACMPVQCHHCEDAPCLRSCLTGAITRQDGVVVINPHRCIGCRNCAIACPFGAIEVFSPAEITANTESCCTLKLVYKCDLCIGEKEPACVASCPNKALRLVDPDSEIEAKRINAINATGTISDLAAKAAAPAEGGI